MRTIRRPIYRVAQAAVRGILTLLADVRVAGRENYPDDGPYLLVINHLHWMDIPVVFSTLRHEVAAAVAKEWYHHRLVGPIARHLGHAVAVQTASDHRALAYCVRWLREGGVVMIAPEGERSATGGLQPGQPGVAYLAHRTGAPIVPLVAWGQEIFWHDLARLRRPRVEVRIGPAFALPAAPGVAGRTRLEDYTEAIMTALARLLPARYRGAYQAAAHRGSDSQLIS